MKGFHVESAAFKTCVFISKGSMQHFLISASSFTPCQQLLEVETEKGGTLAQRHLRQRHVKVEDSLGQAKRAMQNPVHHKLQPDNSSNTNPAQQERTAGRHAGQTTGRFSRRQGRGAEGQRGTAKKTDREVDGFEKRRVKREKSQGRKRMPRMIKRCV